MNTAKYIYFCKTYLNTVQKKLQYTKLLYNQILGEVESIEYCGNNTKVNFKIPDISNFEVFINDKDLGTSNIKIGEKLWLHWKKTDVYILNN